MAEVIKLDEAKFKDERPFSEKVVETENLLIVHFYLKKGQKISLHTSPSDVITTVLKGSGKFYIGSMENYEILNSGETLKYNPKEPHGFEAEEDMIIEAIISPNPTQQRINL